MKRNVASGQRYFFSRKRPTACSNKRFLRDSFSGLLCAEYTPRRQDPLLNHRRNATRYDELTIKAKSHYRQRAAEVDRDCACAYLRLMVDVVQRNRKYNRASSGVGSCHGGGGVGVRTRLLAASQHVDDRVLDERSEHEDEAGGHPDVDRLGEGRGRHSAEVYRALGGDGEHGEDAEGDASRHGLKVDPEGHPGQEDNEQAGQERRQDVGSQAPLEV